MSGGHGIRGGLYLLVARLQAGDLLSPLRFLEESQYWSAERLREYQTERLARLLARVQATVPYYADRLPGTPWERGADASACPFLTKADLQDHARELFPVDRPARMVPKTTGGSTGQPVTIWKTREAWARELAATWRGYGWAGVGIGDRQARFWGVPHTVRQRWKARLIDVVANRFRVSAFDLTPDRIGRKWRRVVRSRPRYFYGYVSILRTFAQLVEEGELPPPPPLQATITTSEVLTRGTRELLRRAFGAPVFDEYGCGELGTIAHECEHGSLHLSEENMLVEVFDGERPCRPGETGEIVVTELNNVAFPLIRYRTGDYGMLAEGPCPCGRGLAVIAGVQGRAYDFIVDGRGRRIHPEAIMYLFEELHARRGGIQQFQVIQRDTRDLLVKIVRTAEWTGEHEAWLTGRLREVVDPDLSVSFLEVAEIPRAPSGKMKVVVGMSGTAGREA